MQVHLFFKGWEFDTLCGNKFLKIKITQLKPTLTSVGRLLNFDLVMNLAIN
jgi:hypothetical protein